MNIHSTQLRADLRGELTLISVRFTPYTNDPANQPVLEAIYSLDKPEAATVEVVLVLELLSLTREDTREAVPVVRADLRDVREAALELAAAQALDQDTDNW